MKSWRSWTGAPEGSYADPSLLDVVIRKTESMRRAARIDDVVPGEVILPTIAALATAAAATPTALLRVLDFGGAAGFHFLVAKQALRGRRYRWAVVETEPMVDAATQFADDELHFFSKIDAAVAWLGSVDLIHSIAALPYLSEPEQTLTGLLALGAPTVMWAKMMLAARRETFSQVSWLRDNGPGPLPAGMRDRAVNYRGIRVARSEFLAAHERRGYWLAWKAESNDSYLYLAPASA